MTRARDLADLSTPNVFTVDESYNVGIGTTVPDAKVDVVGIVSATTLYGDGANLTGVAATDNINTNNIAISGIATVGTSITMRESAINVTGVITATSFVGDGSGLTNAGIAAGKSAALSVFLN